MEPHASVRRTVGATPTEVWNLVSDLPRMGEWSNENQGGSWVGGATGPAVGAVFKGRNRNGLHRWSTKATVTDASPGARFAFDVTAWGIPISSWSYEVSDFDGGCTVTESWSDRRPGWFPPFAKLATGVSDRAAFAHASMEHTLEQLDTALQRPESDR